MRQIYYKFFASNLSLPAYYGYYYDSQVGRFMTLDTWTHLPDDVRLFSYSKYLSWDNYRIEYNPRAIKINMKEILHCKTRLFSYDTLTNEITLPFSLNPVSISGDSVIFSLEMRNRSSVLRYYKITEKYQNQLNGYRYCWNNPVRYIDPTGNFSPFVKDLLWFAAGIIYTEFCTGFPLTKTALEFWKEQWKRFCEWMAEQGKDWNGDWIEYPPRMYD